MLQKNWKVIFLIVFLTISVFIENTGAQSGITSEGGSEEVFIRNIYSQTLSDGRSYAWLETLCKSVGNRLSGSSQAEKAVQWAKNTLDTLHLDSVWLQPVMVPHWVRGEKEKVSVIGSRKKDNYSLEALALGGSVGTGGKRLQAAVVEARSWSDLEKLGEAGIKGKIVFFNRPMDPTKIRSFDAYGGAVDQRVSGASRAAKYGAVAVIVRSMTQNIDQWPHTGSLHYDSAFAFIPAIAISTADAERLSALIKKDKTTAVAIQLNCKTMADAPSFNVIGEIRGTVHPNEILLVGGHLDSWDVGEGAHDDGTGCVQSMDMLRILKRMNYQPKYTIRCVLFMNEENGLRGGKMYAAEAQRKGEIHRCAIETDAGGFTPRGFTFDAADGQFDGLFEKVKPLRKYFEGYNMTLNPGGAGADISPLKPQGGLMCGYYPDSQRYFDFHHTNADVFEAVNKRELELGTASMTSLIYLLDNVKW
jgi:carboxypeptidase Q